MSKKEKILKELTEVINGNSMENDCDTPDYILAEMMYGLYENYCKTVKSRDRWFGFNPWNRSMSGGDVE
jgi:hypothetical protein